MRHRRPSTRALGAFAMVAGAVLLVGAPVAWSAGRESAQPPDLGVGTAVALASQHPSSQHPAAQHPPTSRAPSARESTATRPGPDRPRTTDGGGVGRSSTDAAHPTKSRAAPKVSRVVSGPPSRVRIAALGLDAPVVPVGVDGAGDLAVPADVDTVGWYAYGPAPGATRGSVVLAGHVDSASQGIGAFRALWSATPGMIVRLQLGSGRTLGYRVVAREHFDKAAVPWSALFATTGAPRLTLVTCGGAFDPVTRSYTENVVVTAVPT